MQHLGYTQPRHSVVTTARATPDYRVRLLLSDVLPRRGMLPAAKADIEKPRHNVMEGTKRNCFGRLPLFPDLFLASRSTVSDQSSFIGGSRRQSSVFNASSVYAQRSVFQDQWLVEREP